MLINNNKKLFKYNRVYNRQFNVGYFKKVIV